MSKTKEFLKNLDKGFYQEAKAKGVTAGALLAEQIQPEEPEVEKVYARMVTKYRAETAGDGFLVRLQQFAEETAALQKCLQEAGIRIKGPRADKGEKFFASADNTALFPSVVSNQIIAGQLDTSLVERLAFSDRTVTQHSVDKVTLSDTSDDRTLKFTGEGANMPKTKVTRAEGTVRLYKYGRVFEYSYESARLMSLNLITAFLQKVGRQVGIDETDDLIETLIAGDGTTGSAITDSNDIDAEVTTVTDYDELVRIMLAFPAGYNMTDAIVGDTLLRTVLNLAEVKDPQVDYRVLERGLPALTMFGAMWHRWRSSGAPSFASDNIVAIDNRSAVEVLREGDFLEESDRIIDRSLNQIAMSEWVGYAKGDNNATQLYDGTA
jgi:hypothetical protein